MMRSSTTLVLYKASRSAQSRRSLEAWALVGSLQVPSASNTMSGLRVVCVMLFWTNAALKGHMTAKGLSPCFQPSHLFISAAE